MANSSDHERPGTTPSRVTAVSRYAQRSTAEPARSGSYKRTLRITQRCSYGEFFTPPLTTVRQNATEVGRRGFELLNAEIELGRQAIVHHTVPTELILRASTLTADRRLESAVVPV
jgi:hypothetical protein